MLPQAGNDEVHSNHSESGSRSLLRDLFSLHRRSIVHVGLFSLFINVLFLVPPLYMLQVYDRVLTSRSPETLLVLTLVVVWLFLTMGILELARSRILIRVGNRFDASYADAVHRLLARRAAQQGSKVSAQPLNDLSTIRQFISGNAPFALFDAPWVSVYLAVLFLFHSAFGWFAIAAMITLMAIALLQDRATRGLQERHQQAAARATASFSEQLHNAEVIHAMGMHDVLRQRWSQSHREAVASYADAADRSGLWSSMSKTLRLLFQSLMLGLGAYLAIGNQITAGMVIAGSILMGRALAPIDQLIGHWRQFGNVRAAHHRLAKVLASLPEQAPRMALTPPSGRVTVDNVVLIPPNARKPVLKGVSFELAAGETLLVIGPSAAGKSSLVRAMLGLWPLAAGSVRYDDADVQHWERGALAAHVGYLPQDVLLFDGSVAENIARFGELDHRRVIKAARVAGVHGMISMLPEGYDTRIGADGSTLSGGQRQAIGLARAVYGKPRLVVLDEPNANLDSDGENALRRGCRYLKKHGVSIVMVNHRSRSLGLADKILVMEAGRVKFFGPRDSVLAELNRTVAGPKIARRQIQPSPLATAGRWG